MFAHSLSSFVVRAFLRFLCWHFPLGVCSRARILASAFNFLHSRISALRAKPIAHSLWNLHSRSILPADPSVYVRNLRESEYAHRPAACLRSQRTHLNHWLCLGSWAYHSLRSLTGQSRACPEHQHHAAAQRKPGFDSQPVFSTSTEAICSKPNISNGSARSGGGAEMQRCQ